MNGFLDAVALGYLGLLLAKAVPAWWVATRRLGALPGGADATTVLQPILSGDPELARALADNLAELAHARFLWLIDADDAEALAVTHALQGEAHGARVEVLVLPSAPDGTNPKTFKLAAALPRVATEFLVVLDDDARLPARTLEALLSALERAELATALPYYRRGNGLPARLLATFVNDNAALTYLPLLPFAEPPTLNGMCYALRARTLRDLGGFAPILRCLADDLALAGLVRAQGGRIQQLAAPVAMQTSLPSLAAYARQMHRWFLFATLLLRETSLGWRCAVTLLHGLTPLLLWCLVAMALGPGGGRALLALGAVVAARGAVLVALQLRYTGRARHRPWLSLLSELLQPLHLAHACLVRTIRWRSRVYRVRGNADFAAVSPR